MKQLLILSALAMAGLASGAFAQAGGKSVSRADFIKNLDARFNAVDTNHDGKISRDELVVAQQKDLQQAKATLDKRLQDAFQKLDTNRDGKLSLQEFMASEPPIRTADTPDQLLQRLDTNHDGKVTPDEFRAPQLSAFNKADANHDGIVTAEELNAASKK